VDPVIVIVGPTASGKTALSIELAKSIDGEIISADSMQIYKHMNIGTAKPTLEEMSGIPHYMIDEVCPDEEFNVVKFQQRALKYISQIVERGKYPIIVGGTGLYINSLIYNIDFSETQTDWELRESLKKEVEEKGNRYLYEKLKKIDPETAKRLHENDIKRIIRAIEVFKQTNKTMTEHIEKSRLNHPPYKYLIFGLRMDRQRLYRRIEKRVDLMMEAGLIEEVKSLISLGYDKNTIAMQGLGYKEVLSWLKGEMSTDELVEILKRDTRRYAKRQISWFKRIEGIQWLDIDEDTKTGDLVKKITGSIATNGGV
jgi:tRNA dimethylallyltransferase